MYRIGRPHGTPERASLRARSTSSAVDAAPDGPAVRGVPGPCGPGPRCCCPGLPPELVTSTVRCVSCPVLLDPGRGGVQESARALLPQDRHLETRTPAAVRRHQGGRPVERVDQEAGEYRQQQSGVGGQEDRVEHLAQQSVCDAHAERHERAAGEAERDERQDEHATAGQCHPSIDDVDGQRAGRTLPARPEAPHPPSHRHRIDDQQQAADDPHRTIPRIPRVRRPSIQTRRSSTARPVAPGFRPAARALPRGQPLLLGSARTPSGIRWPPGPCLRLLR
jgi:hypothetical protein